LDFFRVRPHALLREGAGAFNACAGFVEGMCVSVSEVRAAGGQVAPAALSWTRRVREILLRVLSEPLVHFIVAGFVLFVAGSVYQNETSIYHIVVTPRHVAQLANDYALQFGGPPDPQTLEALVQRDTHDEILFRQGLALKLDQDDLIVRRRVVQKMQFLLQDLNAPPEPTDAQLLAYYKAHASHYVTPVRATFTHIYFSSDKGGDATAEARAKALLGTLSNATTRAPDRGDPFPDLYDFSAYEPEQVSRLFGKTPFTAAVYSAPVGQWFGPVRSGYGWHLLYVDARQSATQPPLSAVRDAVRTDYLQDAEDKANKTAFDELARKFTIQREDGNHAP
jgi:peptidyl-prolyl cis-trans isomerase C